MKKLSLLGSRNPAPAGMVVIVTAMVVLGTGSAVADDSSEKRIEEVVVTAQKREERLQDVPILIAVLSGEQMDSSSDRGVADAANRIPGVINSVNTTTARNGSTSGVIGIRGVAPLADSASPSAFYLDSIPFGFVRRYYQPDATAYDLERVEVLKGPQGTLYGLSSLNGVVRVLTKDADLRRFEVKARTAHSSTQDGGEGYRGDMAINVPVLEDKLAARVVLGYQDLGGWIDKPIKKDANDTRIGNYRLKVNAQPTEQLSVGLTAWFSRAEADAAPTSANGSTSLSVVEEPSSTDYDAYSLKFAYDCSALTLNSATSYIDFANDATVDFSPFIADRYLNLGFYSEVLSQEIVLNSRRGGPWRWLIGGLYRDVSDTLFTTRTVPGTGGLALPYIAPTLQDTTSQSFAVFGELTRGLFDGKWDLTVGLRYFEDEIQDKERSRLDFIDGTSPPPNLTGQSLVDTGKNKFDSTVPRVVLSWHPAETATLYASYGEGFRSGLNQIAAITRAAPQFPPAEPDTLTNYEIGAKGTLWSSRVAFEMAAFYMDWQDVQQRQTVVVVPPPNLLIQPALISAGSASGVGFEFGASVMPLDGLTVGLSFALNDLEFDQDIVNLTSSGDSALLATKGDRLLYSPRYTAAGSADYVYEVGGGYHARLSAGVNYIDEQINERTSPITSYRIDAVTLVRASLGVEARSNCAASLYADNLTNEQGVARDQFSPRWNTYLRPRTVGLQFEYRY